MFIVLILPAYKWLPPFSPPMFKQIKYLTLIERYTDSPAQFRDCSIA